MGEVVTPDGEWQKPLPDTDEVNAAYWSAAAEGRLLIQECAECGHRQFYPRALCTHCGGEPRWLECTGRGSVHTFTVVRQNGAAPFRDELPYVVAMVELEEGPRMMGNVTGCDPDAVSVGLPVRAYALLVEDGLAVPMWEPA